MPAEAAGFYKQSCIVCLDNQGHHSRVELEVVYGEQRETVEIRWTGEVTGELRKAYGDLVRATDNGAVALALLLIREFTEYTTVEQAAIGTTIDYYLSAKPPNSTLIFNNTARLEVSGILWESKTNTVDSRVKSKLERLKADNGLPTFIVVVEFSQPWTKMVEA